MIPASSKYRKSTLTVLVVDDNPTDIFLLRYALETTGSKVEVIAVPDGLAAAEYMGSSGAPDLLVIDFLLCGATGLEVFDLLESKRLASMPTILLSGLPPAAYGNAPASRGMISLEKPSSLDGWLDLASQILEPVQPCQNTAALAA